MQFEIGTSTRRYFPASGTAGLARSLVRGKSRVPAPPPRITASVSFMTDRRYGVVSGVGVHRPARAAGIRPATGGAGATSYRQHDCIHQGGARAVRRRSSEIEGVEEEF